MGALLAGECSVKLWFPEVLYFLLFLLMAVVLAVRVWGECLVSWVSPWLVLLSLCPLAYPVECGYEAE